MRNLKDSRLIDSRVIDDSTEYDVYGIGNALLDVEYEVKDPVFLEKMGIQKGIMTLVSHQRQEEIIGAMDKKDIRQMTSGGSVSNSMAAILLFGGAGYFSCKIANDESGERYHQEMKLIGLKSNFDHAPKPAGETGRCLVKVTPDSDRTMSTYLGVSVHLSEAELNFDALSKSKFLYLEGYLLSSPSALLAVKKAKKFADDRGIKTALSLSDPFMVSCFNQEFRDLLTTKVDMLFANQEEAFGFAGTRDFDEALASLRQVAHRFAVTLGPRGSLVFDGENFHTIPPEPVKPIDTLGAGDMYAGAYLYALTQDYSFLESAKLASVTSAYVVTQYGPRISAKVVPDLIKMSGLMAYAE
jgi:sugar/nucleoside kinase (ribokinase family)